MKLKLNEDGSGVVEDGKPVYVYDDGKEVPFDAVATTRRISNLTEEKDRHYDNVQTLKGDLEKFSSIKDPAAAIEALATVENFKDKDLVDAGEVDKLKTQLSEMFEKDKQQMTDTFSQERDQLLKAGDEKDNTIRQLMVGGRFATSPWFSGEKPKTILPPDIAAEHFGKYFKVEGDGDNVRVVGYLNGDKILSRENVGDTAGFEEALGVIINNYSQKDRILRDVNNGSGSSGNTGSGGNGAVSRRVFEQMTSSDQMSHVKAGRFITD